MFICEQGGPSVAELQRLWQMLLELAETPWQPHEDTVDWTQLDQWALLPTTDGANLLQVSTECLDSPLNETCFVQVYDHICRYPDEHLICLSQACGTHMLLQLCHYSVASMRLVLGCHKPRLELLLRPSPCV